ncbi:MAG TPA: APC family permease [Acidimicrobiales bacterium]|nr:APC family permease [Acidimicrobiales bacterium]
MAMPDGDSGGSWTDDSSEAGRDPAHSLFKRLLIGRPLATHDAVTQRLRKLVALPVFSSDAISSTGYGTEVILSVLVPVAGMAALHVLVPISLIVVVLLVILVVSYRQTIFAYPTGGGSYIVSRENLGQTPALVAGASLLVDYTLNVAVSIAAGTAAITSAIVPLRRHTVAVCVVLLVLVTIANLRGLRESATLFSVPVYIYVGIMGLLIVVGLVRTTFGGLHPLPVDKAQLAHFTGGAAVLGGVTVFAFLKAFSSGAVALSGVEAISNGVPNFRPPESRNAATTLMWTGILLGGIFFGVALLAVRLKPTLSTEQTILSTMGAAVFGGRSDPLYGVLQAATAAILCLSANTSFADFPRLSSIIAHDGCLPHQLARRGDRLVFSNGIIALALAAGALLVGFRGNVNSLVPLFAVGLFTAFTLSQAGMVVHHRRRREPGWQRNAAINGLGTLATGLVLVVVLVSKFTSGAWIPTIVIPTLVVVFRRVHRHYASVDTAEAAPANATVTPLSSTILVPVRTVNVGTLRALAFADSLRPDRVLAVSVALEDGDADRIRAQWAAHHIDVPLEVVDSPYRELTGPLLDYIDRVVAAHPGTIVTVVLPELVVRRWWEQILHNHSAFALKVRLHFRPDTIVVSVPFQVK